MKAEDIIRKEIPELLKKAREQGVTGLSDKGTWENQPINISVEELIFFFEQYKLNF